MNVELIKRTVAYIEQHPEEWNQDTYGVIGRYGGYYRYGPKACFFGHALILGEADYNTFAFTDARELLGLDFDQAYEISEFQTKDINELKAKITEQTGITFDAE